MIALTTLNSKIIRDRSKLQLKEELKITVVFNYSKNQYNTDYKTHKVYVLESNASLWMIVYFDDFGSNTE